MGKYPANEENLSASLPHRPVSGSIHVLVVGWR